jgi:hypothetical protein
MTFYELIKLEEDVGTLRTVPRWPGGCMSYNDVTASAHIVHEGREKLRMSLYHVSYVEYLCYLQDFSAVFMTNSTVQA